MTSYAAYAAATETDLLVAARAVSFIENGPRGETKVGIVYDPDNPSSVRDAEGVEKILGDGLKAGNLTLTPVMVKITEIGSAKVSLYFLVENVGSGAAKVAAATKANHIPCVTTDIQQVREGTCVMGVRSKPKVEILVNRATAAEGGIAFPAVFRMMITEL